MKADATDLQSLLDGKVQYAVPPYQRPYVWNEDDQWEPLWQDLIGAAARLEDESTANDPSSHFIGAIVLQSESNKIVTTNRHWIIDGQQRLTTISLVIKAAQLVSLKYGLEDLAAEYFDLLFNKRAESAELNIKVRPTRLDEPAFRAVMDQGSGAPQLIENERISQAFLFFQQSIADWLKEGEVESIQPVTRLNLLHKVVSRCISVVLIQLDGREDPQIIFETLNDRGAPLLAADLVKNYLLRRAETEGEDAQKIYEKDWRPLEDDYWRKGVTVGRLEVPRIDLFMTRYLAMKIQSDVVSSQLFKTYRSYLDTAGIKPSEAVKDLAAYAATYRKLLAWVDEPKPIKGHQFSQRLVKSVSDFEFNPLYSALLWLFGPESAIGNDVRERCARILDSWVVRRAASGLTAKNINKTALLVLEQLRKSGDQAAILKKFIIEKEGVATIEDPNDKALVKFLTTAPAYKSLGQRRVAALLRAVESCMNKNDPDWVPAGPLTVEHVMPSSWRDHWPLESDDESALALRRGSIHNLGNLVLLTKRLNSSIGNSKWATKRAAIKKLTVLLHVREVIESEEWNEALIVGRAEKLAAKIIERWPSVRSL
jgi:uncharacterized protein with ParB-like and HNH nuclease domain